MSALASVLIASDIVVPTPEPSNVTASVSNNFCVSVKVRPNIVADKSRKVWHILRSGLQLSCFCPALPPLGIKGQAGLRLHFFRLGRIA
jgi:hypothetical protein